MGKYSIRVEKKAIADFKKIYKSGNKVNISRVERILKELEETPEIGIGSPERLKNNYAGLWSREINKKDRIIYEIDNFEVIIIIFSALGHYSDK